MGLRLTWGPWFMGMFGVARGMIFNMQRFSVHDGPGIRTTVFMKGCPLRCAWCHNPEGLTKATELRVIVERCVVCGACREVCAAEEPESGRPNPPIPPGQAGCTLCGACVDICPTAAREIVGQELGIEELVTAVLADQAFFEESGGGVTFSGGEPFQQPRFLLGALEVCRKRGLHTVVDTCGMAAKADLLKAVRWTSLFLYDLKFIQSDQHARWTGMPNDVILDNLRTLAEQDASTWIRVPLIPGINDHEDNLRELASWVTSLPKPPLVCLLPYHETALHKFRALGHTCPLKGTAPSSTERIREAATWLEEYGLETRIGG